MPYKTTPLDWFMFAGLVIAWGTSFAMSKVAVQSLSPEWIVALRLAIGAVFLLAVALVTQQLPAMNMNTWFKYFWLGNIGNTIPFFLITWGLKFVSSGISGLLMGTIPVLILGLAHFALPGERLNRYRIAGIILGFSGLLFILDLGGLGNIASDGGTIIGELAIVAGCICYAIHSITAKRIGFDAPFAQSSGVLTGGAIVALVIAMWRAPHALEAATPAALWATVGLGILPTGLATIIMYKLMERTSPTLVSQSNYLVPVYAVVFGALTLGEKIGWNVLIAMALILAGIFVSRISPKPKAA